MDSMKKQVSLELLPWLVIHSDGSLERLVGTEVCLPGLDQETCVLSKDIIIEHKTGLTARIYRPGSVQTGTKLPLVLYFHGGAFLISSAAFPNYHNSVNKLVSEANIIAVSVDYRLAPEHPLPTAYEDSWNALQWIQSTNEPWIIDNADLDRLFLMGDSAGANISHHIAFQAKQSDYVVKIKGIGMIHPYLWGIKPIGLEVTDEARKKMVDGWWEFVCPSEKGSDDPWINPFSDGSPDLEGLGCERVMITVAEKDILRDRGKMYYERLVNSKWRGQVDMMETKGKDHVFHIFEPDCDEAREMLRRLALFINQKPSPPPPPPSQLQPQQQQTPPPHWMAMRYPPAVVMPHQMIYAAPPPHPPPYPPPYSPYQHYPINNYYYYYQSHGNNNNYINYNDNKNGSDNGENKTLWIGDLLHWMDENYLNSSFASIGEISSVKLIRNKHTGLSEGYGFVEFTSHESAEKVLDGLSGTTMMNTDQPFRLNWASFSTAEKRSENNNVGPDLSIFVGDLAPDVSDAILQETFSKKYPSVKSAKVVVDINTGRSKGYGFVRFGDDDERTKAMTEMNGVKCSSRAMRIGPATPRKTNNGYQQQQGGYMANGAFAGPEGDSLNTTIFVGGLESTVTDEDLRQPFSCYGEIVSVKIPLGKGCGFVQFVKRQDAEEALEKLNGTVIGKQTVRLSWGRNPSNKQPRDNKYGNQWMAPYYGYNGYGYILPQPHDPRMYGGGVAPPYGGGGGGGYPPMYGTHQQQVS
ncbi:unnamed protein product [Cochlearia groenlandica]